MQDEILEKYTVAPPKKKWEKEKIWNRKEQTPRSLRVGKVYLPAYGSM